MSKLQRGRPILVVSTEYFGTIHKPLP